MSQPQIFWSIAWADFYMEDICHRIFFFCQSLPKHDIFGDRATVFYKLPNSPIELSAALLYLPWYVWYLYLFHPHKQIHVHTSTLMPTQTLYSNKNMHICKHCPPQEASSLNVSCCLSTWICRASWHNLIHSEKTAMQAVFIWVFVGWAGWGLHYLWWGKTSSKW